MAEMPPISDPAPPNPALPEDDDLMLDDGPPLEPRPIRDTGDLDITPMIDIVFLLLIFFLVTSRPDESTSVELPPAKHGSGISQQTSVIITIAKADGPKAPAKVYLADGKVGEPLPDDPVKQEEAIRAAVDQGFVEEAKTSVIIKAGRDVKAGDIKRVASAIGKAGVDPSRLKLHAAVYEED
jgi:biopolymer transport protein ExbD